MITGVCVGLIAIYFMPETAPVKVGTVSTL
jgi:hypothetical protein